MALHTDLKIYKTGTRLVALAFDVQKNMPRGYKRGIGEQITGHCTVVATTLIAACARPAWARGRFDSQKPACYTAPVRSSHLAGCKKSEGTRQKAAPRKVCGFFISGPQFRRPEWEGASPAGNAPRAPVFLPRSGCRPNVRSWSAVVHQARLETNLSKAPARRNAPHIAVIDGQPTTTSRDIAETFGKRHDDVLKRIHALDCSAEFSARNFAGAEYIDAQGKPRTEYRITRDGFALLCMGFTGAKAAQWKERYINTFNKLADKLAVRRNPRASLPKPPPLPAAPLPPLPRAALLALPAPRPLPADMQAAIDARVGQIVGAAYTEIRQWLVDQVRSGCLKHDGTAAPNFANTLAHADFAAFSTQYASKHLEHAMLLLRYLSQHSGELLQQVLAKQDELRGKQP